METHLISDHRRHRHRPRNQQQQEVGENGEGPLYYCTTCNKSFTRRRDLERHLRSARVHVKNDNIENAGFPCRVCAKMFTRKDTQRKHEGNKSCMKRYYRFLSDARAWMHPPLCETPLIAVVGSSTAEIDYYYNSDISSITTDNTQDDYSVETPSSLNTTTSSSSFPK